MQYAEGGDEPTPHRQLVLDWLDEPKAHRIIIFSSSVSFLALIKTYLASFDITCLAFFGAMKAKDRDIVIGKFSDAKDMTHRVLLVSAKAGGMGLNLVAANKAIMTVSDLQMRDSHDCLWLCFRSLTGTTHWNSRCACCCHVTRVMGSDLLLLLRVWHSAWLVCIASAKRDPSRFCAC
jgi:mannose/fructose/N-acetylgalactosamine-specific phosphotransferase system component IIB